MNPKTAPAWPEDYFARLVLQSGERIVWRGRPSSMEAWLPTTPGFAIGLALIALAIVAQVGIPPLAYNIGFSILLAGIGLWLCVQPWRTSRRARCTLYAVTDRRVLIVTARHKGNIVAAIEPHQISHYAVSDFGNGEGNITLRQTIRTSDNGDSKSVEFADALWGVKDLAGAAKAICALREFRDPTP